VWLVLVIGLFRAIYVIIAGAQIIHLPYETTKPELFILYGAQRLISGQQLYPKLGDMPFVISVYNPLTYLPAALAGRVFGLDLYGILVVGRYISYISTVALGLLLGLWVWRKTAACKAALLAGLGIFYFNSVALTDFFRLRPESPGLLFTFAGVVVFLSGWSPRMYVSAVLFFISFLFKQSFVAAPISAAIFFLASKQYRHALAFSATLGGLLLVFFIIMYRTSGERFFENTIVALAVNEVHPIRSLWTVYGKALIQSSYGLLLAVPLAVYVLVAKKEHLYIITYFLVCVIWTFYSAGKVGAQVNYYSELAILCVLIIALIFGSKEWQGKPVVLLILGMLAAQVAVTTFRHGILGERIAVGTENIEPYVKRYAAAPGKKLITHEHIAVHTGEITGLDWVLLEHLAEKKVLDLSVIFNAIARGEFSLIVLSQHPMTRLEMRILYAVKKGPYRLVHADDAVSEWAVVGKGLQ